MSYPTFVISVLSAVLLALFGVFAPVGAAEMPTVVLNEFLWMGSSASSADEWIELRNTTSSAIDFSGWYLTKKSNGQETLMLTIPNGKAVEPNGFFLISNYAESSPSTTLAVAPDLVDTAVSLVNSQLQIKLYNRDGVLQDVADDGTGAPLAGQYVSGTTWKSMERTRFGADGTQAESWKTSSAQLGFKPNMPEFGTPRTVNSNAVPVADAGEDRIGVVGEALAFDGSASTDADGDALMFTWSFGDGSEATGVSVGYAFAAAQTYEVALSVSDGTASARATVAVTVYATQNEVPPPAVPPQPPAGTPPAPSPAPPPGTGTSPTAPQLTQPTTTQQTTFNPDYGRVILSEVLANPDGPDADGEFIELFNAEKRAVKLGRWVLTNGKKRYLFPDVATIEAGGFLTVPHAQFGFSLLNKGDTLFLLAPGKGVVNGVQYPAAKSGVAFARVGTGGWRETDTPTPGEENEFPIEEEDKESGQLTVESGQLPKAVSIANAKIEKLRTKVVVTGWVAVAPGVLSEEYFYLSDGTAGMMVASAAKAFPRLAQGDHVSVTGTIGTVQGEAKINVKAAEDIRTLDAQPMPEPRMLAISDVSDETAGDLVAVEGTLRETVRQTGTLDDGSGTLPVFLSRSLSFSWSEVGEGVSLAVTGILQKRNGSFRLLPRAKEDVLVRSKEPAALDVEPAEEGQVLGASVEVLPEARAVRTWVWWVGGGGILIVTGAGWIVWKRRTAAHREA